VADFVRICPKCQHLNPEYENLCQQCQQFIAMEPSVKRPIEEASPTATQADEHITTNRSESIEIAPPRPVLYLQLGDRNLTVFDQSILGQQHQKNTAELQIDSKHAGYRYLHRQHCSFHYRDGTWYIQAIDQQRFGQAFTNPTMVNKTSIAANSEHPLHHGDRLHLAAMEFLIHIPAL